MLLTKLAVSSVLAAVACADADAAAASSQIDRPEFTPYTGPVTGFFEQFINGHKWQKSAAQKNDEFAYVGEWSVEEPEVFPGFKGDKGLVVKSPAAHHAITTAFDTPINNKGKTLVVQYEVKLQKGLECGGAYVKLLSAEVNADDEGVEEFSGETPYQVMFGPDKCGSTNKVHFIVKRPLPDGTYEEKHLVSPAHARLNKLTNLYTLVIRPDNTFDIRVNGNVVKSGSLLEEGLFKPSFNPPAEIEDPEDTKPADWVEEPYMPDPEQAVKPADWDEKAPFYIADPEAVKPADWQEETADYIVDPEAFKPEDWDDEEDGEWVAPEIPNPVCEEIGCGPWVAPKIQNPDYKGVWSQPMIENPDYKGTWAAKKIPNPNFAPDEHASDLEPIGGLGFELWTMQEDILFDNIYVGHSVEEAEAIGNATFVPKLALEAAQEKEAGGPEETAPWDTDEGVLSSVDMFLADPVSFVLERVLGFFEFFSHDPVAAIREDPVVAAASFGFLLITSATAFGLLNVVIFLLFGKKKQPVKAGKTKKSGEGASKLTKADVVDAEIEAEQAAEAVASGVDGTSAELKQRKN